MTVILKRSEKKEQNYTWDKSFNPDGSILDESSKIEMILNVVYMGQNNPYNVRAKYQNDLIPPNIILTVINNISNELTGSVIEVNYQRKLKNNLYLDNITLPDLNFYLKEILDIADIFYNEYFPTPIS